MCCDIPRPVHDGENHQRAVSGCHQRGAAGYSRENRNVFFVEKTYPPAFHAALCAGSTLQHCWCVQFDITFPKLPCSWISLDAMDVSGETQLEVVSESISNTLRPALVRSASTPLTSPDPSTGASLSRQPPQPWLHQLGVLIPGLAPPGQDHNIFTKRLSKDGHPFVEPSKGVVGPRGPPKAAAKTVNGTECGSCYGAEKNPGDCCNTCAEVRGRHSRATAGRGWAGAKGLPSCSGGPLQQSRGMACGILSQPSPTSGQGGPAA